MIDPSKLGPLRKHQARSLAVAREIVAGRRHQKVYVAGVTPGGGKTLMASLFANELADHGVIEQVIVVVPNDPLRDQMRKSFHDPARGLDRYLRQQTNERVLPGMGKPFGIVVTYQSLTSDVSAKRYASLASKRPTLVIFDECHHLCENKAWERGAKRLVDASKLLLAMSGTLWRWDEERIPFVNYDADNRAIVDIKYSRADALGEQAILPEKAAKVAELAREVRQAKDRREADAAVRRGLGIKTATTVERAFALVQKMTREELLDFDRQIRPLVAAAAGGA